MEQTEGARFLSFFVAGDRMPSAHAVKRHRNVAITIDAKLDIGERLFQCLIKAIGKDHAEQWAREVASRNDTRAAEGAFSVPYATKEGRLPYGLVSDFLQ